MDLADLFPSRFRHAPCLQDPGRLEPSSCNPSEEVNTMKKIDGAFIDVAPLSPPAFDKEAR
jgi:hypothetical protein